MYDVLEQGRRTMVFDTYDEAYEYLEEVAGGCWFNYDYGIVPHEEED